LLAFGTNAVADEILCGDFFVNAINLWESDPGTDVPIAPCELWITFAPESGQGPWLLPATAFGTQLNIALLKAYNFGLLVQGCVALVIDPPNDFSIRVTNLSEGAF
jgi:hypothetical protein